MSRKEEAYKAQAALASLLGMYSGQLWPEETRALSSALAVVQRLAKSG